MPIDISFVKVLSSGQSIRLRGGRPNPIPCVILRNFMADRALILSGDHYTIPDEKGVPQHLFQLWYCNDYREDSETEVGCKPIKMLTTADIFDQLRKHDLPALFDLELRSRPGKANAAALTVVAFKYVGTPPIFVAEKADKPSPKA